MITPDNIPDYKPAPIIYSVNSPNISNKYAIGSLWVNTVDRTEYICTGITYGLCTWLTIGSSPELTE